jgi:urease beta subunit
MATTQKPGAIELAEISLAPREGRLAVSFLARNTGDHPLYVQSAIRQVEWDAATKTATLHLSDRGRTLDARHQTVPKTAIVEPGKAERIETTLPLSLNRLISAQGGEVDFESIDLREARTIRLVVGVARTPFYANPKEKSVLAQLKAWGEDVVVTTRVDLGERQKPPDRS